jgi:NAD(P)-dependent dehydrogenase (short-subunit alcohol dehydrogenase family)
MQTFEHRIAVVTGGGSGIGRELVRQLAAAGCHVALCDISEPDMAATVDLCRQAMDNGVRVTAHRCDVASEDELKRFQREVAEQHRTAHIHLLFNNAGVSGGQSFVNDDRALWDRVFGICWGGVYLGCRVFMPMLLASPEGHIINTSSINGFWACMGAGVEHTAYSAAKFAVKGFSEALVVDLRKNAPHIKVSVVMPGHIGTSIALNSHKLWLGGAEHMNADQMAKVRERWGAFVPDIDKLPDDALRAMLRKGGEDFRDQAPTTAAQAATAILDGVQAGQWRILVGEDAVRLDEAVRSNPEKAYDFGAIELRA